MKKTNRLTPLLVILACNYLAQIPYGIHQYHGHYNLLGVGLLWLTLLWFLVGYILLLQHSKLGYWLVLSFLFVQVIFYFHNEVFLSFYGYGMLYHFFHSKDWLLWLVFFIGDVNFFVACFYCYYLIKKRRLFL